jgi:PAS domain S-box-containing protein
MAIPEQPVEGLPPVDLATLDLLPDPAWVTARTPTHAYFNVAWLRISGSPQRVITAGEFLAFLHPEDRERRGTQWREGVLSGAPFAAHFRIRQPDAAYRWYLVRTVPVGAGPSAGWLTTAVDVEGERRANEELLAAQARELSIANAIPQLIGITAADGSVISVNASHCAYTGLSVDQMRGTGWTEIVHPDDLAGLIESWQRAVVTGEAYDTNYRLRRRDGIYRWFLNKAQPVRDADGVITAWIGTATDIDEHKRAEGALRVVVEATSAFAETLDAAVALQRLADIAAEHIADWCGVYIADNAGLLKPVAIAHRDPSRARFAREFLRRYPVREDSAVAIVARTGVPLMINGITDDMYEAIVDREEREQARLLDVRAMLSVPLGVKTERYGVLTLAISERDRMFTDADQQLATLIAQRAAIAVGNARLFERQQQVARTLQAAFLPPALPRAEGVQFDAIYAAGTHDLTIGGDWYDAFPYAAGQFAFSVGDVAGRGLDAAVPMGKMRQTFRALAALEIDPVRSLAAADAVLRTEHPDAFVTAFVATLDAATGRLQYANAGHPTPFVRAADGGQRRLEAGGMPLGLPFADSAPARTTELAAGDLLVAFTDGLIEATRDIAEGEARLAHALARRVFAVSSEPARLLQSLLVPTTPVDDVAILTLRFGPGADWSFDANDSRTAHAARREFVARLAAAGVKPDAVLSCETVFGEIVGNAARYTPGPIDMSLFRDGERFTLAALDRGPGFTWNAALPSEMAESGRGLFLIDALSYGVTVEHLGSYGSYLEVRLTG